METVNDKRRMREIKVVERVLSVNARMAEQNRRRFAEKGVFVLNVMSSPGSGKTATLQKTLERIMPEIKAAVIVGDVSTTHDADRLSVTGAPVVQVNTDAFGGDCHLAAHVIEKAADEIDLAATRLLIIENVGNLVCPAEFDTGSNKNAMILSIPEGDDKPLKYPLMFSVCDILVLNKIDSMGIFDFDVPALERRVRVLNPGILILTASCKTGEGIERWTAWLRDEIRHSRQQ
jgi:hydrogenase nickel incorporation protein HypB